MFDKNLSGKDVFGFIAEAIASNENGTVVSVLLNKNDIGEWFINQYTSSIELFKFNNSEDINNEDKLKVALNLGKYKKFIKKVIKGNYKLKKYSDEEVMAIYALCHINDFMLDIAKEIVDDHSIRNIDKYSLLVDLKENHFDLVFSRFEEAFYKEAIKEMKAN